MKPDSEQLPTNLRIQNIMMACAVIIAWTAYVQWLINTWRAQYATWVKHGSKGVFLPAMPRTMKITNYLVGESCNQIYERVRTFGISVQPLNLAWVVVAPGRCGLTCSFWVPGPQGDMADAILHQGQGQSYVITSPAGKLRGYTFNRPWGVTAKARSWDEFLTNGVFGMWLSKKKAPKLAKTNKCAKIA